MSVTGASRVVVQTHADVVDVSGQTGVSVSSASHDVTVTAASQLSLVAVVVGGGRERCVRRGAQLGVERRDGDAGQEAALSIAAALDAVAGWGGQTGVSVVVGVERRVRERVRAAWC